MSRDVVTQTTALVVAGDARRLRKLLASRDRYYPELRALIAAAHPGEHAGVEWVRTTGDAPVNARRNALLARVKTPYVLVLDDADRLGRRANLERLIKPLAEDQFDAVAGALDLRRRRWGLFTGRERWDEFGTFDYSGGQTALRSLVVADGDVAACDYGSPLFAARTDKLRAIGGWDESLQPHQHLELYARAARYQLRVGHCAAATVDRWTCRPPSEPAAQAAKLARAA